MFISFGVREAGCGLAATGDLGSTATEDSDSVSSVFEHSRDFSLRSYTTEAIDASCLNL